MEIYRLMDTYSGYIELNSMGYDWFDVALSAKRHLLVDACELAHEEYGKRVLANKLPELLHIMEPGKIVTVSIDEPVYLLTNHIADYRILHHSGGMCTVNLPSYLTAYEGETL